MEYNPPIPDFEATKQYRFIEWERRRNLMQMDGTFTANDLRRIADWMDIPNKGDGNWIDIYFEGYPK